MNRNRQRLCIAILPLAGIWWSAMAALAADAQRAPTAASTAGTTRPALPPVDRDQRSGSAVGSTIAPVPGNLAPSVRQIRPATVNAGQTLDLLLIGAGFGTRTQVTFGAGVEVVDAPQAVGEGQLRIRVRVATDAAPGPRMPRLVNGALAGSGPASLTVLATRAAPAARQSRPAEYASGLSRSPSQADAATRTAPFEAMPPPPRRADPAARTAPLAGMPPPPQRADPATRTLPLAVTPDRSARADWPAPPDSSRRGTLPPPSNLSRAGSTPMQRVPAATVKLAFGKIVPDTKKPAWGGTERTFDKLSANATLVWQTANPEAHSWRWQISAQPFPADAAVQPPALLNEGDAVYDHFKLDLLPYVPATDASPPKKTPTKKLPSKAPGKAASQFGQQGAVPVVDPQQAPVAPIIKLYIRVVRLTDGKPAGAPSNTVIATYEPRANDEALEALGEALGDVQKAKAMADQAANMFALKIVHFEPAVFPDPNRWGCVELLENPYQHTSRLGTFHPLHGYAPGEHCPKPKDMQKDWFDKWVVGAIEGWALSWNKLTGFYNGAKSWIASQIVGQMPCEWLGEKLEDECQAAAQVMVEGALSAGMAAAGMPPSLPDLDALSALGKGKIAEAAVNTSCDAIESNGGVCTPEMKAKLADYYRQGLDELQKQIEKQMKYEAREPGCRNAPDAAEHAGLDLLPCFSDYPGTKVVPAKGAVYAPPTVKVRVTRKQPQPAHIKGCDRVSVGMDLTNTFPGGYLSGKNLPPAPVAGPLYIPASESVPQLGAGESVELLLVLSKMAVVEVPGNHYGKFYLPNWQVLYRGGKGTLWASMAAAEIATGLQTQKAVSGPCSAGDSVALQIPK
ncbi:MAG: hypothetical protein HS109_11580 [Burkholderiales bacterium]|nr:hypothetical protein [Burkholderiales bacterium]